MVNEYDWEDVKLEVALDVCVVESVCDGDDVAVLESDVVIVVLTELDSDALSDEDSELDSVTLAEEVALELGVIL